MSSIADFWEKSKETFETKNLQQILIFAGDGKLRDGNLTSKEFRELLENQGFSSWTFALPQS